MLRRDGPLRWTVSVSGPIVSGFFGPGVSRVAAHEFAAYLWVEALPEACEVGSGLHGAMIGREQVYDYRGVGRADARGFFHAEEVLQTGGDPGWLAVVVVNLCYTAALKAQGFRGGLVQLLLAYALLQQGDEIGGSGFEFGKAHKAR